jgi:hypothetical protein
LATKKKYHWKVTLYRSRESAGVIVTNILYAKSLI